MPTKLTLRMSSKTFFIEKIIEESAVPSPRVLELACGTAQYMREVLNTHPDISYVGVEPNPSSFAEARETIGNLPNVQIHNQLGYGTLRGIEPESFDIVFSMSALEHIKNLKAFIEMSGRYLKKGGLLVHRYDLGHALYPTSLKEKVHVFLGNAVPWMLPVRKFVRYVSEEEVTALCASVGCKPFKTTYHQMPNGKAFEKLAVQNESLGEASKELTEWEWRHEAVFAQIGLPAREKLFPAVAVWSRKKV